ncbi:Putative ubiquitin-conjugating enzyme E2 [Cavenderia fasciculata]|uniref:Ubiquitin-conjugating enzyme E2 n=1 Tax=Cavenderia fasciculata TaxID=261658 RepID=F4QDY0_CACFS|nr:Putative ubiquitin-conjugating enzyme E2 [Cavenderia fasciculata]EGG13927.1 Putative ubiquitin-conjugating enzyme E2 [Cavenderia fasciculata]|eukprot:XP_004350635.1 Putative ubiquitin-conjugating enzyme E2 [Cavenderia fasciculata]
MNTNEIVEKNIFKEDVVSFLDVINNRIEYGVVFRVAWDLDDITDEDESDSEEEEEEEDDSDEEDTNEEEEEDSEDKEYNKKKQSVMEEMKRSGYTYFDEDNEFDHLDVDEEILREKCKHHHFKSDTGVLVHLIRAPVYTEMEYEQLTLVDRTLYLADFVQRIQQPQPTGIPNSNHQLGKVLSTRKQYSVYPFSFLAQNQNIHLGQDPSQMLHLDHVDQLTPFSNSLVMNKSKTVIGRVIGYQQDLVVRNLANNRGSIIPASEVDYIFIDPVFDSNPCPGKTITFGKDRFVILTVVPTKLEVNWYYYLDENADPPPSSIKSNQVIVFSDDYQFSVIGENVLFVNSNGIKEGAMVFLTKTWCTISWQDGTITEELSTNFVVVDSLATDYFPGDVVEPAEVDEKTKWGVINSYNPTTRTCSILWNIPGREDCAEEKDVSVYSIEYLVDYNFDESDFVFKNDSALIEKEADIVGQVVGRDKCRLLINWNNGCQEKVLPYTLCLIEDDDSDNEEEQNDDDQDDFDIENEEEDDDQDDDDDDDEGEWEINSDSDNDQNQQKEEKSGGGGGGGLISNFIHSLKSLLVGDDHQQEQPKQQEKKEKEEEEEKQGDLDDNGIQKFQLLTSIENHAYYSEKMTITTKLLKTINQEFKLLETSLPKGVYVRGFSEKMNLLQALIIGPEDTVYENGIFIFDIFLPNNYPYAPPKVFYHSVTYKLHPNLYVNGNVCLSLLGTWHGNKNEQWQPGFSNLLQVLISIQGLILGYKEPYFLEAGYESQLGTIIGKRNSSLYNEEVYLLTLETLMFYNNNKPTVFESIITNHINDKIKDVLTRLDQLLDQSNTEIFKITLPPSEGFLKPLLKLKSKIQSIEKLKEEEEVKVNENENE